MVNPRMDGTHKPMKIADSFSPLNHNNSENTKERNAAVSIKKSESVKFLNIRKLIYLNIALINRTNTILELINHSSNNLSNLLFNRVNITT